jgi:hypothetical protein
MNNYTTFKKGFHIFLVNQSAPLKRFLSILLLSVLFIFIGIPLFAIISVSMTYTAMLLIMEPLKMFIPIPYGNESCIVMGATLWCALAGVLIINFIRYILRLGNDVSID